MSGFNSKGNIKVVSTRNNFEKVSLCVFVSLWWKNCVELCHFNFAHGQYRIVARRIISKGISVIKLIFFFDGGDFDRVFVLDNIVARGIRKRILVKY